MRCVALFCVGSLALIACGVEAQANVEAYCEAYAIDFANGTETDEARWQLRREDARSACLLQYTETVAPVATAKAKPKPAKPAIVAAKRVEPEKAVGKVVEKPAIAPVAVKPDISEGTPEWYDYCARKYASFSRKTGKYLSKTGVERKCLVTADFQ